MKQLGFPGISGLVPAVLLLGLLSACDGFQQFNQSGQQTETEATQQSADAGSQRQGVQELAEKTEVADLSVHPGKLLHDANCISCHDAAVYTREDRRISDFAMLQMQVKRCDANLGSRLSAEELQQVTAYLNQAYYNFTQ